MRGKGPAQIAKAHDVVDAPFLHADAAPAIGSPSPRGLDRVIGAERVQLAAGIACRLAAGLAARIERTAGRSLDRIIRHESYCSLRVRRFPHSTARVNKILTTLMGH